MGFAAGEQLSLHCQIIAKKERKDQSSQRGCIFAEVGERSEETPPTAYMWGEVHIQRNIGLFAKLCSTAGAERWAVLGFNKEPGAAQFNTTTIQGFS